MVKEITIGAIPKQINYREFNIQAHTVADMFSRFIVDLKIKNFEKIAIRLYDIEPQMPILEANDVLLINIQQDLKDYFNLKADEKKYWILTKVFDHLVALISNYKFDINIIRKAYETCLVLNINNVFVHGEIQYSKSRNNFGLIVCNHLSDKFEISAHIFNKNGIKVGIKKLVDTDPFWPSYCELLGKVKNNGEEIILYSVDKKARYSCPFNSFNND